jgi:ubiquinone/menaquinone biosynthesis C-methylase UbiE
MHDPEIIFEAIELKEGDSFLDLGCGVGDYAIYAADIVGDSGAVYAVDRNEKLLVSLIEKTDSKGLENIIGILADITMPLTLEDHCIDVCFIATVLHTLNIRVVMKSLLDEIRRVLKPCGCLVVIECKKEEAPFGPPIQMRVTPEEIEALTIPCGFKRIGFTDLGHNYMIQYEQEEHEI